jgi:hypothetical protein
MDFAMQCLCHLDRLHVVKKDQLVFPFAIAHEYTNTYFFSLELDNKSKRLFCILHRGERAPIQEKET